MNSEAHANQELNSGLTTDNPKSAFYGVFAGSQHFIVAGGTFTNTTKNTTKNYVTAPTAPSDLRMIPLGDIDLHREIRLEGHSGVVEPRHERPRVRRVYSAKIDDRKPKATVAVYQVYRNGDGTLQNIWRFATQVLFRSAKFRNVHATIFHDELIPFRDFLGLYRHSPLSTVYIYAHINAEFEAICIYFYTAFQRDLTSHSSYAAQRAGSVRTWYLARSGWLGIPSCLSYPILRASKYQRLQLLLFDPQPQLGCRARASSRCPGSESDESALGGSVS